MDLTANLYRAVPIIEGQDKDLAKTRKLNIGDNYTIQDVIISSKRFYLIYEEVNDATIPTDNITNDIPDSYNRKLTML